MESSREHFESQQPAIGGVGNLKQTQKNAAASIDELRTFLGQLKGRSPQEVMGIVAQSSLVQGITTATMACAALLLVFTVGPWLMGGAEATTDENQTATAEVVAPESETPATDTADATTAEPASSEPDLNRAAKAMGIDKTADADPNSNPLDDKLNNLLDGIE